MFIYVGLAQCRAFTLLLREHFHYYIRVLAHSQGKFQFGHLLTVPISPVFAHYSDIILFNDSYVSEIWHIAFTEYVVISLPRFRATAHDGAVGVACINPQMGGDVRNALFHCHLEFFGKQMILVSLQLPVSVGATLLLSNHLHFVIPG